MTKPIIGIILDYSRKTIKQGGYANFPWYALRMHYSHAVSLLGGTPVFLPYDHNAIQEYLKICNGLLFAGGDMDIDPSFYGEKIVVQNISVEKDNPRIKFEFELLRAALKLDVPIFGICAGFQLLNVVFGGSLYQDIEEQVKTDIAHKPKLGDISYRNSHLIAVMKESLLYKIVRNDNYKVNSFHHQAIKKLGKSLKAAAVAPDNLIEAIELDGHPFCVGVEWHPEFLEINEDRKLFKAFINAAQQFNM